MLLTLRNGEEIGINKILHFIVLAKIKWFYGFNASIKKMSEDFFVDGFGRVIFYEKDPESLEGILLSEPTPEVEIDRWYENQENAEDIHDDNPEYEEEELLEMWEQSRNR